MERNKKGMGGHQSAKMINDEWLTPLPIINALGEFDLDPCSPINRPWDTAKHHFSICENGLVLPWFGRVWLNPPYGLTASQWLKKAVEHNNCIALIFARTETKMFFNYVWPEADSILFFESRLYFHDVSGKVAKANAGAPSVLVAYGENNSDAISSSGLKGKHLPINNIPVIVVKVSPNWKSVVSIALTRLNGSGSLQNIYDAVEYIAPDKIDRNKHHKEKIRQTLQLYFLRIKRGHYSNFN